MAHFQILKLLVFIATIQHGKSAATTLITSDKLLKGDDSSKNNELPNKPDTIPVTSVPDRFRRQAQSTINPGYVKAFEDCVDACKTTQSLQTCQQTCQATAYTNCTTTCNASGDNAPNKCLADCAFITEPLPTPGPTSATVPNTETPYEKCIRACEANTNGENCLEDCSKLQSTAPPTSSSFTKPVKTTTVEKPATPNYKLMACVEACVKYHA